jgi:hypothetical protein
MKKFLLIVVILFATMFSVLSVETLAPQFTGAATNSVSVTTTARVTVLPIYNLSVDLDILNKVVQSGENLFAKVDLRKTDLIKTKNLQRIYVDLNYEILMKNKVVKKGFIETIPIIKYDRETFSIKIPSDFSSGSYDLKIIASSPQAYSASDKKGFLVKKRFWFFF